MFEFFNHFESLFQFYLIRLLPLVVLIIILVEMILRKHHFKFSYQICRTIVLISWGISLLLLILSLSEISFIKRATGNYWWAYWMMFVSSYIVPVLLFFKKWFKNRWLFFIIVFLYTLPSSFEIFVIIITTLHQNFLPSEIHLIT